MLRIFKFIVPVILFTVLFGCKSETPDDLIPRDKFVPLLIDMHITDAILIEKRLYDRDLKEGSYYNSLFKKHSTTRKQFEKSLRHYASNPAEIEEIYAEVSVALGKLEEETLDGIER